MRLTRTGPLASAQGVRPLTLDDSPSDHPPRLERPLRRRPLISGAVTVLAVAALAGCTSPSDIAGDGNHDAPSVVEEVEAEPTPVAPSAILTDTWADDDGYTYTFSLYTATGTATKDVANAKPGEAIITWSYSLAGEVVNTTPERNAPIPNYLRIIPVWPADSPLCVLGLAGIQWAWDSNVPGMEESWCTVMNTPFSLSNLNADEIPMNSTLPVTTDVTVALPFPATEADADAVVAALQSPVGWAVARDTGEGRMTNCLIDSGSFYLSVATIDTGCTAK